jgi:carbon storage regulator
MLIISRRLGQRIVVGSDLEIVVTELSRKTVKLGITAPARMPVLRGEVWDNIARANQAAALSCLGETHESRPAVPEVRAATLLQGAAPGEVAE